MTHESFRELAPLYVIGALDGAELVEFERYVAANRSRCEAELTELQAVADQLALAVPLAQPSPEVLKRVLTAVEKSGRPIPALGPSAERPKRKGSGWESFIFGWIP